MKSWTYDLGQLRNPPEQLTQLLAAAEQGVVTKSLHSRTYGERTGNTIQLVKGQLTFTEKASLDGL